MLGFKLLTICIVATVAGFGAVVNAIWGPRARARRRLERGSQALVEGEVVTLVGKVRQLGELLVAPLSGRACVAYEAIARTPMGTDSTRVVQDCQGSTFEIETDHGPVVVEADTIDFALPIIPMIPRRLELEQEFLEDHGHSGSDASRSGFDEVVVEVGDKIAVQGMAVVQSASAAPVERGYRDAPTRMRLVAHPQHPLTIGRPR